VILNIF